MQYSSVMNCGILKAVFALGCVLMFSACATMAPVYQPDFDSISMMKNNDLSKMRVVKVTLANPSLDNITIRGSDMQSPYGGSYAGYFKFAVEEQLKQAEMLDMNAAIEISCEVQHNDLDASSFSKGTADMSAKFVVSRNGKEVYNRVQTIHHEWPSSFFGATALSNAHQGYVIAVQKLVDAFFRDPALISAASVK